MKQNRSPEYKARERQRQRNVDRANRDFIRAYKESTPCDDCHRYFPAEVMDFDHVRGAKSFNISKAKKTTLRRLIQEIDKCDLVCANCHRIRHIVRDSN